MLLPRSSAESNKDNAGLLSRAIEFATGAGQGVVAAMVRLFQHKDESIHGDLVIEEHASGSIVEVHYIPPPSRLAEYGIHPDEGQKHKTKLVEFDTESGRFTIFPTNTLGSSEDFLKPKYRKVRKITLADGKPVLSISDGDGKSDRDYARSVTFGPTQPLDDDVDDADIASVPEREEQIIAILEDLPAAFTKDYDYGLGLAKPYRFIVEAVEELSDCLEIVISREGETRVDEAAGVFHIETSDFGTVRKMLNSTTRMGQIAGRSVKKAEAYNFFAEILGRPPIALEMGRHRLRKLLTRAVLNDDKNLSEEEQEDVIGIVTRNMRSISESRPERLVRLQNDLELANLEGFIDRFRGMLEEGHGEAVWQEFFDANPFILSLTFGCPIIKIGPQASVGGRKLFGGGEKITDFLMKNKMTNNAAVVEIKTPGAKLVKREFRSGVFSPSGNLSESMVQALDQRYQFQRDIFGIKDRSRIHDIETYAVQCCLVIGTMPKGEDEKKSFELFRGNSKDVQILTFDELLEKLVQLRHLLASSDDEEDRLVPEAELPF